tara:strand:- start:382 stop:543 length:162 start_codon:yes stop_codon:yes gene_type:complete
MMDERIIDAISSAPIDIDPMFYVHTFYMIISLQAGHLIYTLMEEKRNERKNAS